jgi:hypothetical protein
MTEQVINMNEQVVNKSEDNKDWGTYTLERVVNHVSSDLEVIMKDLSNVDRVLKYSNAVGEDTLQKSIDKLNELYILFNGIREISNRKMESLKEHNEKYKRIIKSLNELNKKINTEKEELKKENTELRNRNTALEISRAVEENKSLIELKAENDKLRYKLGLYKDQAFAVLGEANVNVRKYDELMSKYYKAVTLGNYLVSNEGKLSRPKGQTASAYRKDVNDNLLKIDYEGGKSVNELAKVYNMTPNGIRRRLARMGVYKGKAYKKCADKYNDLDNKED